METLEYALPAYQYDLTALKGAVIVDFYKGKYATSEEHAVKWFLNFLRLRGIDITELTIKAKKVD